MKVIIASLLLISLAACGTIVKHEPVQVYIPVPQECVGERPEKPPKFEELYPDEVFEKMDISQKIAAVGDWAIMWVNYGIDLDAATSSCK